MDKLQENPELAKWLEEGVKSMLDLDSKITNVCFVALYENGSAMTGYFNSDIQDMAVFAHKINCDITMDLIVNNIDVVRNALMNESEDEDEL